MKFSEKEIEILGKPVTDAELAEIDKLSATWDADQALQDKHGGNFYGFLAEHIHKKGASK